MESNHQNYSSCMLPHSYCQGILISNRTDRVWAAFFFFFLKQDQKWEVLSERGTWIPRLNDTDHWLFRWLFKMQATPQCLLLLLFLNLVLSLQAVTFYNDKTTPFDHSQYIQDLISVYTSKDSTHTSTLVTAWFFVIGF